MYKLHLKFQKKKDCGKKKQDIIANTHLIEKNKQVHSSAGCVP